MPGITFARKVTKWEVTSNAILANTTDLASLEPERAELDGVREVVMELGNQQIALEAQLQKISRELDEQLKKGEALNARLRAGIRAKYGYQSDKLTEFQLRPIRRRARGSGTTAKTPKPAAPEPASAA